MAEVTLDDLKEKQAELEAMALSVAEETDGGRIAAIGEEIAEKAKELEALALAFQEQEEAKNGPPLPNAVIEVVLTPDQRARIKERTGVEMETVVVPDKGGMISSTMHVTAPSVVEAWAMREAESRKQGDETAEQLQQELDAAVRDLEQSPAAMEKLEERKQDPAFLAGLLNK